jgi:hypothetical protein
MCRKEVGIYRELQPGLQEVGVFTPKCSYAHLEDGGDCSVIASVVADARTDTKMLLLLEDLGGYRRFSIGEHLPHEDALVAVKMIARLHAIFWNNQLQGKKDSELVANMYAIVVPSDFKKHVTGFILGKNFAENLMKKWQDSEFSKLAAEVPGFQDDLQYFGDCFDELIKPFLTTKRLKKSELFQNITFVHGDFHVANICITDDNTAILYDWQCYGYGHGATELSHLMSLGVPFDAEKDRKLLQAYYSELTGDFGKGVLVNPEDYPYSIFEREIMLRFLSYATIFSTMLSFTSPADLESMSAKMDRALEWDVALINMFKRVFHILRDPERDNRTYILTGK